MNDVFLYGYGRSAIGKFGGSLKDLSPGELGGKIANAVIERTGGNAADSIQEVIVGNVLGAGHGMNVSRQVCLNASLSESVPAFTVNKVCGSGLQAVMLGSDSIRLGRAEAVLAGGVESMSQAAHIMHGARWGTKLGAPTVIDSLLHDGLTDAFEGCHMGITAENLAEEFSLSRESQDEFAAKSQQKAEAAISGGEFKNEIVPIIVRGSKRQEVSFEVDEHARAGVTADSLSSLKPAFKSDGTVTAGNASGINDGAAFVVLGSDEFGKKNKLTPKFRVAGYASAAVEPSRMGYGPVPAIQRLLSDTSLGLDEIDAFELNEAFAAQSLAVLKGLKLSDDRVNQRGGAIALGHPIGASGARVFVTLASYMEDHKLKRGIASLCVGGGQGVACLIESL